MVKSINELDHNQLNSLYMRISVLNLDEQAKVERLQHRLYTQLNRQETISIERQVLLQNLENAEEVLEQLKASNGDQAAIALAGQVVANHQRDLDEFSLPVNWLEEDEIQIRQMEIDCLKAGIQLRQETIESIKLLLVG